MSEPETQTLIGGPGQYTAINVPAAQSGRSSRAYKVAGITLLACVLIAGQAMVAYFLLSQRSDIKSLEDQSNDLKAQLAKGRSVAVPMRMHLPMNSLPMLMDDSVDQDSIQSTEAPEIDPNQATVCQLEAAGLKPVQVPGFKPVCDERGLYLAQQCYEGQCWCVNPADGRLIPGSVRSGRARCGAVVVTGSLSKALTA